MTATITLLHLITPDDLIGCTHCGTHVTIADSKCIESHRVCEDCFGPDPVPGIEPPY